MLRPPSIRWSVLACILAFGTGSPAETPKAGTTHAVTKSAVKQANKLFQEALRLHQADKLDEASAVLDAAVNLDPTNITHATAREHVRQERVSRHMNSGNELLNRGQKVEAAAEFRAALEIDGTNTFATQRLQDASGIPYSEEARTLSSVVNYASEPELTPKPGNRSFDFRGSSRSLIEQVAGAFGISVSFDESVPVRQVRFRVDTLDFATAMLAVRKITKTFAVPLSATQVLFAADNLEVRRRMERTSLRTFYVPQTSSPQELQDLLNTLRTLLDIRFVNANAANSTLTVRAPKQMLDAAERLIQGLGGGRPEVMLDVYAYQVSRTRQKQVGVDLPLQFTAFSLSTELRALVASQPDIQNLINQLTQGGQLTTADANALAALVAAQQSGTSPLFQPFATFGGGTTLFGLTIPPVTVKLNFNEANVKTLEHASLRAQQGQVANFHVGDRYPVLTSAYSPVLSLPIPLAQPRPTNNLQPLTPSFTYEDLGLTLKTTPFVSGTSDVTLQFELGIRALAGTTFNTVPTISNREYTGTITLKEGEPSLIMGSINETEQRTLQGLPWLSLVPGLKYAVSSTGTDKTDSQILLVVVPHVVRSTRDREAPTETYLDGS